MSNHINAVPATPYSTRTRIFLWVLFPVLWPLSKLAGLQIYGVSYAEMNQSGPRPTGDLHPAARQVDAEEVNDLGRRVQATSLRADVVEQRAREDAAHRTRATWWVPGLGSLKGSASLVGVVVFWGLVIFGGIWAFNLIRGKVDDRPANGQTKHQQVLEKVEKIRSEYLDPTKADVKQALATLDIIEGKEAPTGESLDTWRKKLHQEQLPSVVQKIRLNAPSARSGYEGRLANLERLGRELEDIKEASSEADAGDNLQTLKGFREDIIKVRDNVRGEQRELDAAISAIRALDPTKGFESSAALEQSQQAAALKKQKEDEEWLLTQEAKPANKACGIGTAKQALEWWQQLTPTQKRWDWDHLYAGLSGVDRQPEDCVEQYLITKFFIHQGASAWWIDDAARKNLLHMGDGTRMGDIELWLRLRTVFYWAKALRKMRGYEIIFDGGTSPLPPAPQRGGYLHRSSGDFIEWANGHIARLKEDPAAWEVNRQRLSQQIAEVRAR